MLRWPVTFQHSNGWSNRFPVAQRVEAHPCTSCKMQWWSKCTEVINWAQWWPTNIPIFQCCLKTSLNLMFPSGLEKMSFGFWKTIFLKWNLHNKSIDTKFKFSFWSNEMPRYLCRYLCPKWLLTTGGINQVVLWMKSSHPTPHSTTAWRIFLLPLSRLYKCVCMCVWVSSAVLVKVG